VAKAADRKDTFIFTHMKKGCSIHVSGKVQGVFFRASTKDKADELGVKGFVRNERDGSVYIEAEAEEGTLKLFIDWCKQGPRMARVDVCEVKELGVQNFSSFEIRR
jgi:acylphosphatase